jgi:toxin ParE1/3/4
VSEYIISQPAIRDLESISSYFADVNVEAGEKFLQRFGKRCQQLASFPNIGRSYDDLQVGTILISILCPKASPIRCSIDRECPS